MVKALIQSLAKRARLSILKLAIRQVEKAGLAVVQMQRRGNAIYIVGSTGTYVRFDKEKKV
jgi:hypothetical protein